MSDVTTFVVFPQIVSFTNNSVSSWVDEFPASFESTLKLCLVFSTSHTCALSLSLERERGAQSVHGVLGEKLNLP